MMKWQQLVAIGILSWGISSMTALPTVQASSQTRPTKLRTAPRVWVTSSQAVRLYQLKGTGHHAQLRSSRSVRLRTGQWQLVGTTMIRVRQRQVKYVQINNVTSRIKGWVLAASVKRTTPAAKKGATANLPGTQPSKPLPTKSAANPPLALVGDGRYTKGRLKFQSSSDYLQTGGLQTQPETLLNSGGYADDYHFQTALYLPEKLVHRNLSDPQSAAFSANNRYLYVMYVNPHQAHNAAQTGWVLRYDWQKLMRLGLGTPGKMALLRQAALDQANGSLTTTDQRVLACVKVGPEFDAGHAQSLALNPQTNQFWFIQADRQDSPNTVARLNVQTLTPDMTVTYESPDPAGLGTVLTFDDQGQAYYWTKAAAKNGQAGGVQLFRGQITPQAVQFTAMKQTLATAPGHFVQSMGYSDVTGRLYLVSDASITSLPAQRLGRLKTGQVGEINFATNREFEGLIFMHHAANGYLLTNRGAELMQLVPDQLQN